MKSIVIQDKWDSHGLARSKICGFHPRGAVLGALRTFLDSNELWVLYTGTVSQLQQLLEDIQYLKIGFNYCTLDDVNLLNLEYSRIKEDAENNRLRLRMDDYGKN